MAEYSAYGTLLKIGTSQVETSVIVGTITGTGNATITTTDAILAGSPLDTVVAVVNTDVPVTVATKMAAAMNLVSALTDVFTIVSDGPNLVLTRILAAANDATLNIAYTNTTCTGLTPDATSNDTTAGAVLATVAQVEGITGPGLSIDMADVTTHDSTSAFEEAVPGIIRTGEIGLDIVYDPADDTHDATGGNGLLTRLNNKTKTNFSLVFTDTGTTTWALDGFVTNFEPGMPHDDKLSATVTVKVTGVPTLV